MTFETPILFLVFNRPEMTQQVFETIKQVKPKYLYIAADGPREGNDNDNVKCEKVRKYVLANIDWEGEVKTLFREKNLGCGKGVSSAITWFFENVEEGIILEDDCVPSLSFFNYCSTLLEKYRNNDNIYVLGGNNFQKRKRGNASYYFSAYGHIWGWATWRRAWKKYDFTLETFDDQKFYKCLENYFSTKQEKEYWLNIFNMMKQSLIDTWDYQWTFTQWYNNAINILPNVNLVKNIGFTEEGTHTTWAIPGKSDLVSYNISKIVHPHKIKIDRKADLYTFRNIFLMKKEIRIKEKIKKIILSIIRLSGYDVVKIKNKS